MALRNTALDDKIQASALREFREKGFAGASLRTIAAQADATVGAIRTRYRTKDELFLSCIAPLLWEIGSAFTSLKSVYTTDTPADFLTHLKTSMQTESAVILRILFAHYDEAVLLLSKSQGSTAEHYFDEVIRQKTAISLAFFRETGNIHPDETLLRLLITQQFQSYAALIAEGLDESTAARYMNALIQYHYNGFCALFDAEVQKNPTSSEDIT